MRDSRRALVGRHVRRCPLSSVSPLLGSLLLALASSATGADLARLPIRFEPSDDGKAYVAGRVACDVRVTATAVAFPDGTTLRFTGADAGARAVPEDSLPGCSTYFGGSEPSTWRQAVPQYGRVRFVSILPGIDIVHHGTTGNLEHDFVVAPGVDPGRIRFSVQGPERVLLDDGGDLVAGRVRLLAPVAWQRDESGARKDVSCRFVRRGAREFGFELGERDAGRELVIDPVIVWSTYLTGDRDCDVYEVSANPDGSLWAMGYMNWNTSEFPHVGTLPDSVVRFLVQLAPDGDRLLASTFFHSGVNAVRMARDDDGSIYLAGVTSGGLLPLVNPIQDTATGTSGFLMKLDASGANIEYSTYFGQTDISNNETLNLTGLAIDRWDQAVIAGYLSGTIPTANALQPESRNAPESYFFVEEGFVAKFAPDGRSLVYSTYLGGSGDEELYDAAVDGAGNAYVVGLTYSADFPAVNPCMPFHPGESDGFVAKLDAAGASLVYSTTFGGSGADVNQALAVDPRGDATVFGSSYGGDGIPLVEPIDDRFVAGAPNLYAFRLSPFGDLEKSTYLSGGATGWHAAATVDGWGRAIAVGFTMVEDFPQVNAPAPTHPVGAGDAFVVRLSPSLDAFDFSCRFGGNVGGRPRDWGNGVSAGVDGSVYVGGTTSAHDFPTTPGTLQPTMPPPIPMPGLSRFMGYVTRFGDVTPHVREPSALDLRDVPPVVVSRDSGGASLRLGWEESTERKQGLYGGTLASLWQAREYDHVGVACDLGSTGATLPMPPGSVYFLVVDRIVDVESSYGRDSYRRERPASATPCR